MRKNQHGFTLMELVVVVAIVSILGAFALPRFAILQADARLAKMQGALGSMKSAAAMAHAALITRGFDSNLTGTPSPAIVMEGATVNYVNGYPDAASIVALAGLEEDYVVRGLAAPRVVAADANHTGTNANNDCTVSYTPPTNGNMRPAYALNATAGNCT